jgi:hypothetical protein
MWNIIGRKCAFIHQLSKHKCAGYSTFRDLTFVILEGDPIMSDKGKVLDRLNRMGYTTKSFPHLLQFNIEYHLKQKEEQLKEKEKKEGLETLEDEEPQPELEDCIPSFLDEIDNFMDDLEYKFRVRKIGKYKDNHIFIDASPYSAYPYLHSEAQTQLIHMLEERMYNLKTQHTCKAFICEADIYESRFRLGGHKYKHEQNGMKNEEYINKFRSNFDGLKYLKSEEEIVDFMHSKYNELMKHPAKWFDNVLITTDTQQATCTLLEKHLNLHFKLPAIPQMEEDE